jgi:hypothetical protein
MQGYRGGLAVLIAVGMAACSQPRYTPASEEQIDLLASDAHVIIGDTSIVLPLVALPEYAGHGQSFSLNQRRDFEAAGERLRSFSASASNPATAPTLDKIEVNIRAYGWNDFDTSFRRICPRLKRRWSKAVCNDPWAPLRQSMPENRFYLVDARKFDAFDNHLTVGGDRVGDQLRTMRLGIGEVSTVCDKVVPHETRFCTAAVRISRNFGAVWTVWDGSDGRETHQEQAKRESRAIKAFVSYAIGPSEDDARLLSTSCASRRPGSSPGPNRADPCAAHILTPS